MNPYRHSLNSVKRYGGKVEDYIEIHSKMDCSKSHFPDNRHRTLTHTQFWIQEVMVPIFGHVIKNSDNKKVSVKDICEEHILEDFRMKFIPTVQDFLQEMELLSWMNNGNGFPQSAKKTLGKIYEPESN